MSGAIQETYGKLPKGFKGQVANSNPVTTDELSAVTAVRVGTFVAYKNDGVEQISNANKALEAGVALKSSILDGDTFEAGESVTVAKKGSIFVYCETACTKGAKVFVRHTDNADLLAGDVRNDADVDKAYQHATATFAETLTTAGLVEINL